jgi:spermidine synthase
MNKEIFVGFSVVLFILLALVGNYNIQQMHSGGFYRTNTEAQDLGDVVYYEEGLYATVSVREFSGRGYSLFINGKPQGSYAIKDLRVNMLLSYLPFLINSELENALVIGLGTGTTSGQVSQITKTTTIEIEPKILESTNYFNIFNANVLENPNHTIAIDDGRNYLLKDQNKYGAIIPEPSDPWQSFSSALFSKEFFELASEHLDENGLFVQWVSIYQMSPEDFKSFYHTFNSVFPNVVAFANIKPDEDTPIKFKTSEIILVGSKKEIEINEDIMNENYNKLPNISKEYLKAIVLDSGEKVQHLMLFTDDQLEGYAENAQLITDNKPLIEFSSARKVFDSNPQEVLNDINKFIGEESV